MNIDTIRTFCLAFPNATENLQWGNDLCFKIGGKIFAIAGLDPEQKLCFKCTPETFAELTEQPDIRPAPYVGRYNWVLLDRLDALRDNELKNLIQQSYEMVAAKAPRSKNAKNTENAKNVKTVKTARAKGSTGTGRKKPASKKSRAKKH